MIRSLWRRLEEQTGQYGYKLEWRPEAMRARQSKLDCHFELAAAHLMLSKRDIFFIEIGANDGVSNDPVWPFVRDFGWSGIMIEPIPHVYADLAKNYANYPDVRCVNSAVSQADGEATIYTVKMEGSSFSKAHQFSTFRKEVLLSQQRNVSNIAELIIETKVPTLSFETLLREFAPPNREVDILQIDVEGYDAEVIRMIDFSKLKPKIIHYERCNLSKDDQVDCATRLAAQGYRLAMNNLDVTAYLI